MKLLVATPTATGYTTTGYAHTLSFVHSTIQQFGGTCRLATCDGASVTIARNILISQFLEMDDTDQLLFLDSDLKIEEEVVKRILTYAGDICGAIYPRRSLDLTSLNSDMEKGSTFHDAFNESLKFDVVLQENGRMELEKFVPVTRIGLGFFRVSKSVLLEMIHHRVVSRRQSWAASSVTSGYLFDFFSEAPSGSGDYLGEDYSFCDRLLKIEGTKIMGLASAGISHQGLFNFRLLV